MIQPILDWSLQSGLYRIMWQASIVTAHIMWQAQTEGRG